MPIEKLSIRKNWGFRHISSCFRWPKFQIFPGENAPGPQYVHSSPFSSLKRRATKKITDKLPVRVFVYNLTILMRKQKCKQGMWKWCGRTERLWYIWQTISWLHPCKSGANLLGPMLPCSMLSMILVYAISFKKGLCVHLPYSAYWPLL